MYNAIRMVVSLLDKKWLFVKKVILLSLVGIVGVEGYFIFKNSKNNEDINKDNIGTNLESVYQVNSENLKYLVDPTTSYFQNGLNFKVEKNTNKYYVLIDGLKDKTLEKKINNKIKSLVDKNANSKTSIVYNHFTASYSNVLSLEILEYNSKKNDINEDEILRGSYWTGLLDTENVELQNGQDLKLEDVIYDVNGLKGILQKKAYDLAVEAAGLICSGGPCENPYPDFSGVEDTALQIMNKFKLRDYRFYFKERWLYLIFDDLSINDPEAIYETDFNGDNCQKFTENIKSGCVYIEDDYVDINGNKSTSKTYIDLDNKQRKATITLDMTTIYDNVLIYDKYVTDDNLFLNDNVIIDRKFTSENSANNFILEKNNTLIDYDSGIYEEKVFEVTKDLVLQEMLELQTKDYNVYNLAGAMETLGKYSYVYYQVSHYDLDEEIYQNDKKKIYVNKFSKMNDTEFGPSTYKSSYEFLKDKNDKSKVYFYIIDSETGKEYNSIDIVSQNFDLGKYISNEWLSLGKYKTKEQLISNLFITSNNVFKSKDRLILDIGYDYIALKYQGKEVYLCKDNYDESDKIKKELLGE